MTQLALFKYDGVKVLPIDGFFFLKPNYMPWLHHFLEHYSSLVYLVVHAVR